MKRRQVLSAAAALLFVATAAQAQRGQDDRRGRQDQHDQHEQQAPQDQHRQAAPQDRQRPGGVDRRGGESQQRGIDRARDDQVRAAQRTEQEAQLEREREAQANRAYDRDRDYRPAFNYRYRIGSAYRETNQFGVDVLRQAVDQGYDQGYRAGLIDRRDGAPADSRRALDFESGGFGYSGAYVPQSDYSYYFGEGFQRGYDDGYWNRSQYGTFSNGKAAILGAIALGILGLTLIH